MNRAAGQGLCLRVGVGVALLLNMKLNMRAKSRLRVVGSGSWQRKIKATKEIPVCILTAAAAQSELP